MFEVWPIMDKCTVVAKKELLYAWPFGLAAWLCGLVFIDRLNGDKAREAMNEATKKLQENKVLLFYQLISDVGDIMFFEGPF
jgi:lysophosphatidate acyltransferase